jgi:deoxyribodipyrimidine photo-lyase
MALPLSQLARSRDFEPTRAAALARLAAFLPNTGRAYAATRNTDFGPDDRSNVSVLSPYIRHRLVTEHEVLEATLGRFALSTAEKFVQEVYWRTYFKGHLETRPQIWSNYTRELAQQVAAVEKGGGLAKAYGRAVEGNTGIDCFDAWVKELIETGYLHNHTRMWFASIWIFTLKLPWELGADFTLRHFLDGDPASNTLSWRWVGGLHTRGKTYLARAANIAEHTNGRFRPKGLAADAPALDEPPVGSARPLPPAAILPPQGPALLLLTEEDLHAESLPLGRAEIAAVAGALATESRSPLPVSPLVMAFAAGAIADGLARASTAFGCEATMLDRLDTAPLVAAARATGVKRIITAYAPIGPVAGALNTIEPALKAADIELVRLRRSFDTAAWPHGSRGFFAMKEKIPDLLVAERIFGKGGEPLQADLFGTSDPARRAHR